MFLGDPTHHDTRYYKHLCWIGGIALLLQRRDLHKIASWRQCGLLLENKESKSWIAEVQSLRRSDLA